MSANRSIYALPPAGNDQPADDPYVSLDYWESIIGPTYPYMAIDIDRWHAAGLPASVIMCAMDSTCTAPRPSWAYLRAIINCLMAEGVRTVQQYQARAAAHASRRKSRYAAPASRPVRAQQYTQRQYTDAELSAAFVPIGSDQAAASG